MKNEFLQQKLGELIYILGERDFNAITTEFWQNHINEHKPFNDKQIQEFKDYLTVLAEEANELAKTEQKDQIKSNTEQAINILKKYNINELLVCRFGIYREYELAGEKINVYPFDIYSSELEDIIGDDFDDVYEQLSELLYFINEDYIYDVLGYDEEGQNELYLTQTGFKTKTFRI